MLLHAGFNKKRAILFNLLSASLAIVGAVITLFLGARAEHFTESILPLAAGAFIYIAGSDLLPELQKEVSPLKSFLQLIALALGVELMLLLTLLE